MSENLPQNIYQKHPDQPKQEITNFPAKMPWDGLEDQYTVSHCKLCNSKYREEAEELYDKCNGNSKRVHKFLVEERHEDISYGAVNGHLKNHYAAHNNEHLIKGYSSRLESWLGCQSDQRTSMLRAMAGLDREVCTLQAIAEGLSLSERRKTDDTIVKMSALLLNYRAKLKELDKEQEPVTLVLNQLQIILQDEMADATSAEVKGVVKNVLTRLKTTCSDIINTDS